MAAVNGATVNAAAVNGAALQDRVEELSLLFDLSQTLDRSLALDTVVGPVLEMLAERLGMTSALLTIVDRRSQEIRLEAAHGLTESERARGRYRPGEGIIGRVVAEGRPAVVASVANEPSFLDRTQSRRRRAADEAFLCVPIRQEDVTIGTLAVAGPPAPDAVLQRSVRVLSVAAALLAQAWNLRREALEQQARLAAENARLQERLGERGGRPARIVGTSREMRAVFDLVAQVAASATTVLLRGESGTGKELVARAIHDASPRAAGPFVTVNGAALPETLVESELFGHVRGAFTGAVGRRDGRFERAHGGTILLDEVGDLTPATQVKLLRVLQERSFERVGSAETVRVDVRVIAATNRDLEALIAAGRFREDLYYRLAVFPIALPPLRERKADVLLLADHFVEKFNRSRGPADRRIVRISTPAIDMMMSYHWPGNVRELENCIERACLVSRDGVIHGHDLPPSLQTAEASGTLPSGTLDERLAAVERELIVETLKLCHGNMAAAARRLGVTERVMGLRVRRHGVDWRRFRTGR